MFIYQTQLEGKVKEIIEGSLLSQGYELVKVRLKGAGRDKTLLIMLDRVDGVGINVEDCQKASQSISVLLDVEDPIEGHYSLEVSSPGISRPLTRHKDFVAHKGTKIKVITKLSVEGRKSIYGVLNEVSETGIVVEDKELEQTFPINFDNILESHLYVDFGRGSDERRGKQGIGVSKEQNTKGGESAPRRRESREYDAPKKERSEYPRRDREEKFAGSGERKEYPRREEGDFRRNRDDSPRGEKREYPRREGSGDSRGEKRAYPRREEGDFRRNRDDSPRGEKRAYPRREEGDFRRNREDSPRGEKREYPRREGSGGGDFRKKREGFDDNRGGAKSYSKRDEDAGFKREKREYTPREGSSDFNKKPEGVVKSSGESRGYRPREESDTRRTRVDENAGGRRERSEYPRKTGSQDYRRHRDDFKDNRGSNRGSHRNEGSEAAEGGRKEFGGSNENRRRSFDDNAGYDKKKSNFGPRKSFKGRSGNYNNNRKGS
jgi:ribosome maturation factor RimP